MWFRVWGWNSIKNHSLTQVYLFKVTVYVYLGGGTKARICRTTWTDSKWRPVPWRVMVFWFQTWSKQGRSQYEANRGTRLGKILANERCLQRSCYPLGVFRFGCSFFLATALQNTPLWSQKWKGNMLQNTPLQRNGCLSPKSDDNMNDSCVKTQTPRIWSELKLTADWLAWNFVDFTLFHPRPRKLRNVLCFECKSRTMGLSRLLGTKW